MQELWLTKEKVITNNNGKLSWKQRRFLAILGLPAFGIALAYTVVTTYLPVLIERLSGPAITGIIIGGEGIFALFVPLIVGAWSDSLRTRLGRRMPFVFAGAALAVIGLVFIPLSVGWLVGIGIGLSIFFIAYFVYYSPYYALFPDLVPDEMRGRSQGIQGAFRSVGMLASLVGGGLLLHLWEPLPFLVAIAAIVGVTLVLFFGVRDRLRRDEGDSKAQIEWTADWYLVRDNREIRLWVIANSFWEAAIAALRAFIVLYFTRGLGLTLKEVSGALALVGVAAVVAAPLSGKLADRFGHRPVMLVALWGFGLGLLPPLFTTNTYFIAGIIPVAFSAVVLITLPYSVLMGLLPEEEHHGAGAALFGFSRGVGVLAGPLLTGIAIELLKPVGLLVFEETQGYAAMFGIASALLLISIPILSRMKVDEERAT